MFKKCACLALILGAISPAFALYWGVFDDYQTTYKDYATMKFLKNRPIKYYIEQDKQIKISSSGNQEQALVDNLTSNLNEQQKHKELKNLIEQAFNTWPKNTEAMVKQEKRTAEFADIMPYLSKNVILEEITNKKQADIIFRFTNMKTIQEECEIKSNGCFSIDTKEIIAPNISDKNGKITSALKEETLFILIHEIGHYFALTDQYEDTGFDSLEHSTFNRMDSREAVMGANFKRALTCDDVDGFINLIDLTLSLEHNGKFSQRAQNGWASFCNGKKNNKDEVFKDEFYKEAKLIDKPEYVRDLCVYRYDKNGTLIKTHCLDPLDFKNKEIVWNKYNLPLNVIDKENHLKYSYSYEFEKGFFNIYVFGTAEENKDTLYPSFRFKKAGSGDSYYWLDSKKPSDEGMVIEITRDSCFISEPITEDSADYLNMFFDKESKLISVRYTVPFISNPKGIKKLYPFYIEISPQNKTCSFVNLDDEMLFQIPTEGQMRILYQNQEKLNKLLRKSNFSMNKFIEELDTTCKKQIAYSLVEKKRSKCNFFTSLDTYFN